MAKCGPKPRPLEERLWAKVNRDGPVPEHRPELGPCWPWTGWTQKGYGQIHVRRGERRSTHRLAYELLIGAVPGGLQLDHLCHNGDPTCPGGSTCRHRRCCNPAHLTPATNRENSLRGVGPAAQHARKTHCPKGHPYDQANTHVTKLGRRHCRTCHREHVAAAYREWQRWQQGAP